MPWLDQWSDEALEASCAQADENSCQGWAGPVWEVGVGTRAGPHNLQHCHAHRSERETAARISQEIGDLMKEIETLVEEKTKESLDVSRLTREGESAEGRHAHKVGSQTGLPTFTRCQHPLGLCSAHHIPASA